MAALAVEDIEAVRGDHREGAEDGLADALVSVRVRNHDAALLAVLEEGVAGETLARGTPLQVSVVGGELVNPRIEEGGLDAGGSGCVGVGFGGDVDAMLAGIGDHFEQAGGGFLGARVDVDDVKLGTGDGGGGDHFAQAQFAVGQRSGGAGGASEVDVASGTVFGGDTEHVDDLAVGGSVGVGDAETDGGGTLL